MFNLQTIRLASKILIFLAMFSFVSSTNTKNELSSLDSIVELLDNKVYEVPGYGSMRFVFNKKDYALENAKVNLSTSCSADDVKNATFDVNVKKEGNRRYDNIDYKLKIEFPTNGEYRFKDPNEVYYKGFQFIEISDFPCTFLLLGNGQLYFEKTRYQKLNFSEVKNRLVGTSDGTHYTYGSPLDRYEREWIECILEK
jgi:hypothetical protein